jgi:hypothetical protein
LRVGGDVRTSPPSAAADTRTALSARGSLRQRTVNPRPVPHDVGCARATSRGR